MVKPAKNHHMVDVLFALALFCAFAGALLTVVLMGADVYHRIADGMQKNFELRTSLSYVSEKIRRGDAQNAVYLGELEGIDALVLEQPAGDQIYRTYIYFYDGVLREVLAKQGAVLTPENGQPIAELAGFSIEQAAPGLFLVSCTGSDQTTLSVLAHIRSAAAPH